MEEEILVKIPAGIEDGQTVRLRIDGEQEVIVQVKVEDRANLRREGYHVYSDLWIDIWDAAFGKTVTIPGLYGDTKVKLPKLTSSHTVLTLPHHGFQKFNLPGQFGNHYLTIKIKSLDIEKFIKNESSSQNASVQ